MSNIKTNKKDGLRLKQINDEIKTILDQRRAEKINRAKLIRDSLDGSANYSYYKFMNNKSSSIRQINELEIDNESVTDPSKIAWEMYNRYNALFSKPDGYQEGGLQDFLNKYEINLGKINKNHYNDFVTNPISSYELQQNIKN